MLDVPLRNTSQNENKSYLSVESEKQHLSSSKLERSNSSDDSPSSWKGNLCGIKCMNYNINPFVFIISCIIIWGFTLWCLLDGDNASIIMSDLQSYIVKSFSWLYIGAVCLFLIIMIILLIHPKYSQIKLGKPNEPPKYNLLSWFAMLFCAGYGISLYFYGVAEGVTHFRDAVEGLNRYSNLPTQQQATNALNLQWFHGGFIGLSIYCLIGLLLAFLSHKYDFPMTMRTCFYPLIGNKIYGIIGDIIDITAVVATMFGVTTALGLGTMQINAGMTKVFGENHIPNTANTQIIIIWCITMLATFSVVTGIDKGIRRLSELNFGFGCLILFYLFFSGDSFFLLNLYIETIGVHFSQLIILIFDTDSFEQIGFDSNQNYRAWMSSWTVFFWAWWIAWSPFVGTFIAQISQGRTVRQFILGNMLIPAFVQSVWTGVFGGNALQLELNALDRNIGNDCYNNPSFNGTITDGTYTRLSCAPPPEQLFILLEFYPLSKFLSVLSIIGIMGYFITSSDSASFVIDLLTSNGLHNTPKLQRIFWALTEGAVATSLLAFGGDIALAALQTVSVISALPFTFVLISMVYGLFKAFDMEKELDIMYYDNNYKSELNNNEETLKYVKEQKKWNAIWKVGFFDGLLHSVKTFIESLFVPCFVMYKNGNKVAIFGDRNHRNFCSSFIWHLFIFIPPISFVILHIIGIFNDGYSNLAWCAYILFVVVGMYHRSKIREFYRIKGNALIDLVSYFCCYCFATAQESLQCNQSTVLL